MSKLYKSMSEEAFEKGYFYATELKAFAKELGVNVGTLRKNEVEDHIKAHLSGSADAPLPKSIFSRKIGGSRDRLLPDSYVSGKTTKAFLKEEFSKERAGNLKDKFGQWH